MSWHGYGRGDRVGFVISASALLVLSLWLVAVAAGIA